MNNPIRFICNFKRDEHIKLVAYKVTKILLPSLLFLQVTRLRTGEIIEDVRRRRSKPRKICQRKS